MRLVLGSHAKTFDMFGFKVSSGVHNTDGLNQSSFLVT